MFLLSICDIIYLNLDLFFRHTTVSKFYFDIKKIYSNFRTIFQCALVCNNEEDCGAFDWDETTQECTLISKEGLLCDVDKVNSVTAKLRSTTLPSTCSGK